MTVYPFSHNKIITVPTNAKINAVAMLRFISRLNCREEYAFLLIFLCFHLAGNQA